MNRHIDINWLFFKYYHDNPELRRVVMTHSEHVARKALDICRNKKLKIDPRDVYCAAMLHDIGVVYCNAPSIHAFGKLPYLQHGVEGQKILEKEGLVTYSKVCARHTGAGITSEEIKQKGLPMPKGDYVPRTLLEKLICYADKFYSKSGDLTREKTVEEVRAQMQKFGPDSLARFENLHTLFS